MHREEYAGALLGAWAVLNIAAYRVLATSGWPTGSELRVDLFAALPPWARVAVMALAFAVPAVLVPLWLYVERITNVDREVVTAACRWSLTSLLRPASLVVLAVGVALMATPVLDGALWFVALAAIVFMLVLPLGIFSQAVAASPTAEEWWKPRWPGLQPFLAAAVLFIAVVAFDGGMSALDERIPALAPLTAVVASVIGIVSIALTGTILLFGLSLAEVFRRRAEALSWRRLGPIVAIHARLAFVVAFVMAPVGAGALVVWKVLPAHAAWAESRGAELPAAARALAVLGRALETSGMLMATFVLAIALWLMVSRVLWSVREPRPL